jgi:hypothetical protein
VQSSGSRRDSQSLAWTRDRPGDGVSSPPSAGTYRQFRQPCAGHNLNPMRRQSSITRCLPVMLCRVEMLHQRAAERHIQDLNAPADRQHGGIVRDRSKKKRGFQLIARVVGRLSFRMWLLAVSARVHIGAAHQDKPPHLSQAALGLRRNEFRNDARSAQPCRTAPTRGRAGAPLSLELLWHASTNSRLLRPEFRRSPPATSPLRCGLRSSRRHPSACTEPAAILQRDRHGSAHQPQPPLPLRAAW